MSIHTFDYITNIEAAPHSEARVDLWLTTGRGQVILVALECEGHLRDALSTIINNINDAVSAVSPPAWPELDAAPKPAGNVFVPGRARGSGDSDEAA